MKQRMPSDRTELLVRIDRDQADELRKIAGYEGCSMAYLVRHAIAVELRSRRRQMEEIDAQSGGRTLPVRGRP